MCCDVLMYNSIHYHRAVEAQKSLTRVQRIKNKLRNLGKKKANKKSEKKNAKKSEKQPLPDSPIIDVEMIEVEPICKLNSVFFPFMKIREIKFTEFSCNSISFKI